jgi:ADP-ribosylglycohydrolase
MKIEQSQIVNSALWAAYGDALGFMTELGNEKIVLSRTGQIKPSQLLPWKRQIGGRFGTTVDLPCGAYSDDTQLRLATSRAISSNGNFAIHAFSKIELPTWQNYALGAGRGSKMAASGLAKQNTTWFNNFYDNKSGRYVDGGGNGAAMRIQPHIWSATNLVDPQTYLLDVIKNSVTTHGHPRAIAGAAFHANSLAYVLTFNRLPSISELRDLNAWTNEIPRIVSQDINLDGIWKPLNHGATQATLETQYAEVFAEIELLIDKVEQWHQSADKSYSSLALALDLFSEQTRGSGTLTALAATAAAYLLEHTTAEQLMIDMINTLNTDTDTIATMTGAIIGTIVDVAPQGQLQDHDYIVKDAQRLFAVSQQSATTEFKYPDNKSHRAPSAIVDYVTCSDSQLSLGPFGQLTELNDGFALKNGTDHSTIYQWVKSAIGQTFLIKRRNSQPIVKSVEQLNLGDSETKVSQTISETTVAKLDNKLDIDELVKIAISSKFDATTIGEHVKALNLSKLGATGTAMYVGLLAGKMTSNQEE